MEEAEDLSDVVLSWWIQEILDGQQKTYYGGTVSESVLDDCLRHAVVPWGRVVVAIKCGPYKEGFDFTAERITRSLDDSLAHLGLDYDIEFTNLDQDANELLLQLCGCCLGYGLLL
ncbi:hypothetical protein ACP70R_041033 [Stipagrostis hirtigluma subsp. patula]